jgi:hypothetical protein
MNSYQRLLVHRLANCFGLVHSVDAHTKAVFLAKTPSSFVYVRDVRSPSPILALMTPRITGQIHCLQAAQRPA